QDFWIDGGEVRGSRHIEDLPCAKIDGLLMIPAHPADIARGLVPELLPKQEALSNGVVRPERPVWGGKALVARCWLHARSGAAAIGADRASRVVLEGETGGDQLGCQLRLQSRRQRKMSRPVDIGEPQRSGGNTACLLG